MGLDTNGVRFLLYAQRQGVNLERLAMIGRQRLNLAPAQLQNALTAFGQPQATDTIHAWYQRRGGYAEPVLEHLGARDIHSLDYSSYEQATHICDLNRPLAAGMHEQYSAVLDGGSLEHVFNYPVAIKSCMEMVRVGGHFLSITTANNFLGHGFYQFSPELFFSIFTAENGFELQSVIAVEDDPRATWYAVKSPREVRGRVTLINRRPVYLLVIARRVARVEIFAQPPQQSDYVAEWTAAEAKGENAVPQRKAGSAVWLKRHLLHPAKRLLKRAVRRSPFERRYYTPIDPAA